MKRLAFMASSVWLWDLNSTQVLMRYKCWKYISFGTSFCMGGVCDCHLYLIMHLRTVLCSRLNDMMWLLQYFTDDHLWPFQGLIMLEKELAYLGSVCAAALMKKDLALPIGTEIVTRKICWCTFLNEMFFSQSIIQDVGECGTLSSVINHL